MLVLSIFLTGCGEKEEIIAKVNGEEVSKTTYEKNVEVQKDVIERTYGSEIWSQEMEDGRIFEEVFRENILEGLIKETIILQKAKEQGIEVKEEEVNVEIEKMKEASGGEENFKNSLEQNNITEDYLREGMRNEMIMNQYREKFMNDLEITDQAVKEYYEANKEGYEQAKVRHILVEKEEEAVEIINQLENGADFTELASEKSIDPGSASNGGVYDYFPRGRMVPQFEEVAFTLEPGKISEPVQTDYGYHIIEVIDRKDTFEELEDIVIQDFKAKKFNDKVEELREEADVKTFLEEE